MSQNNYNQEIEKFAPKATRKVKAGDVFCVKLREFYYWGRVIKADAIGANNLVTNTIYT